MRRNKIILFLLCFITITLSLFACGQGKNTLNITFDYSEIISQTTLKTLSTDNTNKETISITSGQKLMDKMPTTENAVVIGEYVYRGLSWSYLKSNGELVLINSTDVLLEGKFDGNTNVTLKRAYLISEPYIPSVTLTFSKEYIYYSTDDSLHRNGNTGKTVVTIPCGEKIASNLPEIIQTGILCDDDTYEYSRFVGWVFINSQKKAILVDKDTVVSYTLFEGKSEIVLYKSAQLRSFIGGKYY